LFNVLIFYTKLEISMFPKETKILIIDDFTSLRQIVAKQLKELGFSNITEAEDIRKAWELINNANPPFGLILSDWNMPGGNGIDLLKRIRSDDRNKKTPFIMMTTESETSKIINAVMEGSNNFIVKPFNLEILKTKLEATHKAMTSATHS